MDRLHEAIGLGLVLGIIHGLTASVGAVPVVPNFSQGSMTSHTETTSKIVETINSIDYNTGYTYSVTGSNIKNSGESMTPPTAQITGNANGISATWTGLDLSKKPNWVQKDPGASFQFTESYLGPGLQNQTIIQRTTEIQSITDTTSIFTQ
ncbi:hypothetical protein [Cyanophage S-TIM5]|uniref:Uncharacterized protein n=1 Tax=Cyanophage S-TIM5 TaxID=1137745 RepID=H6WG25_9CAUD|nr:hypothetical protein F417_gp060 [Cyanophage S-TIM5]AEZ65748.1 hypothetical protein [Cyanophage S-TIM5]UYE96920.1 hypothetical protein [Cyanophage S-TIM66]UYE97131.1 hypothetical protein [Cyanophage S-TIM61]